MKSKRNGTQKNDTHQKVIQQEDIAQWQSANDA